MSAQTVTAVVYNPLIHWYRKTDTGPFRVVCRDRCLDNMRVVVCREYRDRYRIPVCEVKRHGRGRGMPNNRRDTGETYELNTVALTVQHDGEIAVCCMVQYNPCVMWKVPVQKLHCCRRPCVYEPREVDEREYRTLGRIRQLQATCSTAKCYDAVCPATQLPVAGEFIRKRILQRER